MSAQPVLTGYAYSVYSRAVRMALAAKDVAYKYVEADPFDAAQRAVIPHRFGRVPVFDHDGFRLYETQAILDYLEAIYPQPALGADTPQDAARMRQVMGITDAYLYQSLVRQVVSEALFAPLFGERSNADVIAKGMQSAPQTLGALEEIAQEGLVLTGQRLGLADCLLWPMIDYFRAVPDGATALAGFPAVLRWANHMAAHPVARDTQPDLEAIRTA